MRLILIIPVIFLLSSCAVYQPNTLNMPLFRDRNEGQIGVAYAHSGMEGQIAYSVLKNIAIMGNVSYKSRYWGEYNNQYYQKHLFYEGGLGFHERLGDFLKIELYGGYGEGSFSMRYNKWNLEYDILNSSTKDSAISTNVYRFFVQPVIGFESAMGATTSFEMGLSCRFSQAHMNIVNNPDVTVHFMEPACMMRFSGQKVAITFQVGGCLPSSGFTDFFNYSRVNYSMGLLFYINRKPLKAD